MHDVGNAHPAAVRGFGSLRVAAAAFGLLALLIALPSIGAETPAADANSQSAERRPSPPELPTSDRADDGDVRVSHDEAIDAEKSDSSSKKESAEETESTPAQGEKKKRTVRPSIEGLDLLPIPVVDHFPEQFSGAFRDLLAAQVSLKFAVAEHGDLRAISASSQLARQAAESLNGLDTAAEQGADDFPQVAKRTATTLVAESEELRRVARGTLFGRFPLLRGFGLKTGDDEEFFVRSFTVEGEARRRAVAAAFLQLAKGASSDPLHAVILIPDSIGGRRVAADWIEDVDALASQSFANFPNLKLYPGTWRLELPRAPAWDAPDEDFDPLARAFLKEIDPPDEPRTVMLVMVRQFWDDDRDGLWVQVQQRTYEGSTLKDAVDAPEDLEADKVRIHESLVHDRHRFDFGIGLVILSLFLAALCLPELVSLLTSRQSVSWQRWLVIPAAGFLIGLVLTPLTMVALERWLPVAETNALRGAWWPSLAGGLSMILPAGVFRLAAGSIGRYLPTLSCHGRWGNSFVPVALGVTAGWVQPACYALGGECVLFILALAAAATLLVYSFGRAIDSADQFPVAIAPIVVILALVFGVGAFLGSAVVLGVVAALAALTAAIHAYSTRSGRDAGALEEEGTPVPGFRRPRTVEQLAKALEAPLYQPPREFDALRRSLLESDLSQARWVGFSGPTAAGKTAAARHLIAELQRSHRDLQVLAGRCTEESAPYQPFREALAELGVSARLLATRNHGGEVNSLFERLADEFIPFWDFFSGYGDDDDGAESTRSELFAAVRNSLQRLMEQRPLLIFLDDVQWIDDGSAALLEHLKEEAGPGSDWPLVVVLASRDRESLKALDDETGVVVLLTPPTAREQCAILERSLGIESRSARHIVGALGVIGEESGGMFWLMQALRQLLSEGAFVATPRGLALEEPVFEGGRLPVPEGMRSKLVESLRAAEEHLPILECAALLGERFRVADLAECLEIDRLALLQILRRLEQELQLVRDLTNDEECYAFSSSFLLEIVRERLTARPGFGSAPAVPTKIARELHGRIAAILERRKSRSPRALFRIAQHSFQAGSRYAEAACDHCLRAARAARRQGDMSLATKFLAMAEQSARRAHRTIDLEEARKNILAEEGASATNAPLTPDFGTAVAGNVKSVPRMVPNGTQRKTET